MTRNRSLRSALSLTILLLPVCCFAQTTFESAPVMVNTTSTTPRALILDFTNPSYTDTLTTVLGRLNEGNGYANGTYLGVRSWATGSTYTSSFSIEHQFYGQLNSSINFYRGGGTTGGFLTFSTNTGIERLRIDGSGNVGINTTSMSDKLDVNGNAFVYGTPLGLAIAVDSSTGYTVKAHSIHGGPGTSEYRTVRFDCATVDPTGGWEFYNSSTSKSIMYVAQSGYVGIGTTTPQSALAVDGTVTAKQLIITTTGFPDYVFGHDYHLLSLDSISRYTTAFGHLPGIPTAAQVEKDGLDISNMQKLQLQKIEELTLYAIGAQQQIREQQTTINQQSTEMQTLKQKMEKMQAVLDKIQSQLDKKAQ